MRAAWQWLCNGFGLGGAARVAEAYRRHFDPQSDDAKAVLADLALYCRAGQTSFVTGDPHQTSFNEGARDVLLHILELARIDPQTLPSIIKETYRDFDIR